MNKKVTTVLFLFLCLSIAKLSAKDIIIDHPVYEFKNTGINNVSKIELRKNETRVHIHTTFIPHWWVKFSPKSCYLADSATGETWNATGIEKGEFDKEIYMPASGDSTFILIFPPLDKRVKKVDLIDDESMIFGISLNPKAKAQPTSQEIPAEIAQWMEAEIAKAKRQTPSDLSRESFFCKDTARIVGYIRGYSPKSGIKTAITYIGNDLTREDHTRVIEVFEDGRFEGKLPLSYPVYSYFSMKNSLIQFYIEPGQTLGVILDWDDYLQADRYRSTHYKFQKTTFTGPLAQINKELADTQLQLPEINSRALYETGPKLEPKEFMVFADSLTAPLRNGLLAMVNDPSLHRTSRAVLRATHEIALPYRYLDYEMSKIRAANSTWNADNFYEFLKEVPLDDHTLLLSPDFSVFINRFEYCAPLQKASSSYTKPAKSLEDYLFGELGLKQTAEDVAHFNKMKEFEGQPMTESSLAEYQKASAEFAKRYLPQIQDYSEKYVKPLSLQFHPINIWERKDSVYAQMGLLPSIAYDITKVRSLTFELSSLTNREEARQVVDVLTRNARHPFLQQEAERIYNQQFPLEKVTAYELPETEKGTEIFRKAIAPHKGKYIFVDFWATTCGPCIAGIKSMKETRAQYKEHPELVFIFLTDEGQSPLAAYDKFVEEQEMEFTHRLTNDEYVYLRQLFAFNGIPRYVLVDKEGKIVSNDYRMHQFKQTVKELGLSQD